MVESLETTLWCAEDLSVLTPSQFMSKIKNRLYTLSINHGTSEFANSSALTAVDNGLGLYYSLRLVIIHDRFC